MDKPETVTVQLTPEQVQAVKDRGPSAVLPPRHGSRAIYALDKDGKMMVSYVPEP